MQSVQTAIDSAIRDAKVLRTDVSRLKSAQVTSSSQRERIKQLALAWFNDQRPAIKAHVPDSGLKPIDQVYQRLLEGTVRSTLRKTYTAGLRSCELHLGKLLATPQVVFGASGLEQPQDGEPPDFSTLTHDVNMQAILRRRWIECSRIVKAEAALSSIVMIGGLLEALLVSKINQLTDKSPLFKLYATPKDRTGKPLPLQDWGLKNYIGRAIAFQI